MPTKSWVFVLLAASLALPALAQYSPAAKPEVEVLPPPPNYSQDKLLPVAMRATYSALKFGVDPSTLSITDDGLVRYVIVAYNDQSLNAMFEDLRCSTGEVRTLARSSALGQWTIVKAPQWRSFFEDPAYRYALSLAKQGACDLATPGAYTTGELIKRIRAGY